MNAADTTTSSSSPCTDRLCEIGGRDRAIAVKLREEAAKLIKLAEALELNGLIATAAAADLLGG